MRNGRVSRVAAAIAAIGALFLLASAPAMAHAKVLGVVPAAQSTVASPKLIQARFSEAVELKLSKLTLSTADGLSVPIMGMNDAKDPTTLSIMPNAALKPGVYKATWSVVTGDGHKMSGSFSFTVK